MHKTMHVGHNLSTSHAEQLRICGMKQTGKIHKMHTCWHVGVGINSESKRAKEGKRNDCGSDQDAAKRGMEQRSRRWPYRKCMYYLLLQQ